jgi:hypothetical protein
MKRARSFCQYKGDIISNQNQPKEAARWRQGGGAILEYL